MSAGRAGSGVPNHHPQLYKMEVPLRDWPIRSRNKRTCGWEEEATNKRHLSATSLAAMGSPVLPISDLFEMPIDQLLQSIRHSAPGEALVAAKLLCRAHDSQSLEQDGIRRAMLKVAATGALYQMPHTIKIDIVLYYRIMQSRFSSCV